jgi:hypothetical protein
LYIWDHLFVLFSRAAKLIKVKAKEPRKHEKRSDVFMGIAIKVESREIAKVPSDVYHAIKFYEENDPDLLFDIERIKQRSKAFGNARAEVLRMFIEESIQNKKAYFRAVMIGCEREASPEEEIAELYRDLQRQYNEAHFGSSEENAAIAAMNAVHFVLDKLDHDVEGITNKPSPTSF